MEIGSPEVSQNSALERSIRGVLVSQIIATVLVLLSMSVFCMLVEQNMAYWFVKLKSASYGSLLAIAGTILSARSIKRTGLCASESGQVSMVPVFSGLLNKLVIVGGGIAFGLIVLELEPIVVVTGYFVVQIAAASRLLVNEDKIK